MDIVIVEKSSNKRLDSYGKVISFFRDQHINVDNYAEERELTRIYDDVYERFYSWVNDLSESGIFFYSGIDMMNAYGKRIFNFLVNLYQKVHVVENILKSENPRKIWISKTGVDGNLYPCLSFFIKDIVPENIEICYFDVLDRTYSNKTGIKPVFLDFIRNTAALTLQALNARREKDKQQSGTTLISSDIEKIPVLFDYLKDRKIIFLREQFPLNMAMYCLKTGINIKLFSNYRISRKKRNEIKRYCETLRDKIDTEINKVSHSKDVAYYSLRFIKGVWDRELEDIVSYIERVIMLLEENRAESLLVDEDRGVKKSILVQVAKKYNCRTFVNMHGEPFHKIGFMPLVADYIFAWGDRQKEYLKGFGLEESDIIVTGCSKYDKYSESSVKKMKENVCREFNFSLSRPLVVVAPFPLKNGRNILENVHWNRIKDMIVSVADVRNVQIIIKLHPGDDNELCINSLVKDIARKDIRVLKYYDPLKLAKAADVLVVYASTFALDGFAYKKPVIVTDEFSRDRYGEFGCFYDGTSKDRIKNSLERIISGKFKDHIEKWEVSAESLLNFNKANPSEKIASILSEK